VLAGIWGALAILLSWLATLPNHYAIRRDLPMPQSYPFLQLGIEILITAVVFAVLAWALTASSWRRVWKIGICFVLSGMVGLLAALGSMHAPAHFAYFGLSMLLVAVLSLLTAIVLTLIGVTSGNR
jgi:hypothetical protein